MHSDKKKYFVCTLENLAKSDCFGVDIVVNEATAQYFLIYHKNTIFSYLNRCPHTGVNLDWVAHQFLDRNHEFIQCATHGALFSIKEGLCLRGPCVGDKLQIVENVVFEGNIYLIL